jgi:hypothetical protein
MSAEIRAMSLPVLEREICAMLQLARRSAPGHIQPQRRGQLVDQSRRGHSVTDDDQRLAHRTSLFGT